MIFFFSLSSSKQPTSYMYLPCKNLVKLRLNLAVQSRKLIVTLSLFIYFVVDVKEFVMEFIIYVKPNSYAELHLKCHRRDLRSPEELTTPNLQGELHHSIAMQGLFDCFVCLDW